MGEKGQLEEAFGFEPLGFKCDSSDTEVLGDIRIKVELNELIYIYQISAENHHAEHLHLNIYTYP